jgi:hypothetical protein
LPTSLSPELFTPCISILIFVLSFAPVIPPSPNFKVPNEFPGLGRYIKPLPIDKSPFIVLLPDVNASAVIPCHSVHALLFFLLKFYFDYHLK